MAIKQLYPIGARVYINRKKMLSSADHFQADCVATVEYTYAQKWPEFDAADISNYSLRLDNGSSSAWYNESWLEPETHYHRAFSSVGLCGASGPHSLTPTCATCTALMQADDDHQSMLRDPEAFWRTHCWKKRFDGDACGKPATFKGPQHHESALVRAWRACDDHRIDTDVPIVPVIANQWTAVPLPPDVETLLARDYPSPPCRDGSTEACVPGTSDVGRCVYCRRELL